MPTVEQPERRIDVALADSNSLVLTAMSEFFERDPRFSLVATAANAEGFVSIVNRVPVRVGVIDWHLSGSSGAALIETLRALEPAPKIVVYGTDDADLPRQVMAAGAAGFVSRTDPVQSLLDASADVAAGRMVFPFVDIRALQDDPIRTLSRRERAILNALSKGLTNRELARELDISMNTVKFHLSNLYDKLDVKNRAQAIAFYYSSRAQTGPG